MIDPDTSFRIITAGTKRHFIDAIVKCMEQEKVGLDEAIRMAEQMVHIIADIEPLGGAEHIRPQMQKVMAEVFTEAAAYMRAQVQSARELIRLADQ